MSNGAVVPISNVADCFIRLLKRRLDHKVLTTEDSVALLKYFRPSQREILGRLQFRAEAYNLLNWVNLGNPGASLAGSGIGRITSAGAARVIQLGLRYEF